MSESQATKKQAVLLIHGIGKQLPMETLRKFVDSAIEGPEHSANNIKYFSRPDLVSDTLEMRKLSDMREEKSCHTDFFEYYWAYKPGPGKWCTILFWLFGILRRPAQFAKHWRLTFLFLLHVIAGLVVIVVLVAIVLFMINIPPFGDLSFTKFVAGVKDKLGLTLVELLELVVKLLVLVVSVLFGGYVLNYVGDAEKYLSIKPANIKFRQRIRSDGLQILRHLHQREYGYDRIIVIGHSLGSVIAYDLIRYLWIEFNAGQRQYAHFSQEHVDQFIKQADTVKRHELKKGEYKTGFQSAQHDLWADQFLNVHNRQTGETPWLISDLITLGSPLAHGHVLLTRSKEAFETQIQDRELPVCPQVEDKQNPFRYFYESRESRGSLVPHHAAPFSCTRWTNIYYPDDLVGGPVAEVFGYGIQDIRAPVSQGWSPLSHIKYWKHPVKEDSPMAKVRDIIWPKQAENPQITYYYYTRTVIYED